jgi:PAP2 superfamily
VGKRTFDTALAADLAGIPPGTAMLGVAVGQEVARQILAWRSTDGANTPVPYVPGTGPGVWQPTPPAFLAAAAPQWATVTPFCIPGDSAFRPPPTELPDLNSPAYTVAFDEVKSLGARDSTARTAQQTEIARFWAGGPGTFTSGGYWNQIAQEVAVSHGNSLVENARLFALLNLAQADAYFAVWDAKYAYNFWRPVTAIRAADTDGNPDTVQDSTWTPLLVTPNHPSYISGHSGHSAAAAAALAAFFGTDAVSFSLSTDSLPGVTHSYASFSAAVREVSDARVYAGIHWRFDVEAGEALGYAVGNYVVSHCLLPASASEDEGGGEAAGASGHADPVAGAVVTPPSRAPSGTRAGVIPVFALPATPAGTVSPAAAPPRPAAPVPASDTDSPPPGVPSSVASWNAAAGPALRRARKPAGAGALADGLVEDLPSGDSLGPASWRGSS